MFLHYAFAVYDWQYSHKNIKANNCYFLLLMELNLIPPYNVLVEYNFLQKLMGWPTPYVGASTWSLPLIFYK